LDFLRKEGLEDNTLVVFTSDNGPVLDDGYEDEAAEKTDGHIPAGPLRGGKYSLYDGGTRVPFIVQWKGNITPGTSEALVSQVDFYASFAAMTGQKNKTIDSENVLGALLGKKSKARRTVVVEDKNHNTVLREDNWVLIPPYPGEAVYKGVNIESGNSSVFQLYDLNTDIGEQRNVAARYPDKVRTMMKTLEGIKNRK
jgi:arylsulfatase A-like enzyme